MASRSGSTRLTKLSASSIASGRSSHSATSWPARAKLTAQARPTRPSPTRAILLTPSPPVRPPVARKSVTGFPPRGHGPRRPERGIWRARRESLSSAHDRRGDGRARGLGRRGRALGRVGADAAAGLLRTRGRRRPAFGARGRVHRHPASALRGADIPVGAGQARRDLHGLRPEHRRRGRGALADEPLVPDADGRGFPAQAAGHRGDGVRVSDPARNARGVADRICRGPQPVRRRRRDRRHGLRSIQGG